MADRGTRTPPYEFAVSLTSQFYFCALPLRFDSYSRCQFACHYCFARARGGAHRRLPLRAADPTRIRRYLEGRRTNQPASVVAQLIRERQPLHIGGMTDPFSPIELDRRVTLSILEVLAEHDYPAVVSTKGTLFERDEYLEVLQRGRFVVQASISSTSDALMADVDVGTPGPSRMLRALGALAQAGIPAACRIQPLLPRHEDHARDVVAACAEAGVRHIAVEHLKLPVERSNAIPQLSRALGIDLVEHYRGRRAVRVGREWVLPTGDRLPRVLELREVAHDHGMTFGAADNDLLLLSDGEACCSGVDTLAPGFSNIFRYTYTEACRRGGTAGDVRMRSLKDVWAPSASISRFVNSSSRLPAKNSRGATLPDYIRHGWNGSPNGNSPLGFYGVEDTGESDDGGFRVYRLTEELRRLVSSRRRTHRTRLSQ